MHQTHFASASSSPSASVIKPDILLLTDALRDTHLTGIGRYVLELARGLQAHSDLGSVRFFAGRGWVADPCGPFDRKKVLTADAGRHTVTSLRRALPWRSLQDRISFSLKKVSFWTKTRSTATPVLHGPNYLLLPYTGPSVVTIHDLSFLHYPAYHPKERLVLLDRELPKTLCQADHILTDSEFVRQEILQILGVAAQRVSVTPLGVDPAFQPMSMQRTRPVLRDLHLEHGRYLLCVATREPRKNLARLLTAYAGLPTGIRAFFPLVLAGSGGWLTADLERVMRPLETAGAVRRLGYVPEHRLPALVAGAAGLTMPSFYEGFGLPVLEAMACGVPVLTANRASLPEVAGDAALLVDPDDEQAIREGMEQLLTDELFRQTARERGLKQAARFTWAECVEKTIQVYRRVTGKTSDRHIHVS
ncbi:glycosyltransferase family 4 protein [Desulfonatronum thioautotrophicum]|uniref:glycosyltransferase family 4 protein n=1 Tax=Desulfonatronum thioautotrophicum TaxID=617001 RepID=UPI0013793260|nr:glycosyltransferase family 1 protein [Desulfonatronum thioautotrophicum]